MILKLLSLRSYHKRCIISEGRKIMSCRKWQARQFYSYAQYTNWAEDLAWLTPMSQKEFDELRNQILQ